MSCNSISTASRNVRQVICCQGFYFKFGGMDCKKTGIWSLEKRHFDVILKLFERIFCEWQSSAIYDISTLSYSSRTSLFYLTLPVKILQRFCHEY